MGRLGDGKQTFYGDGLSECSRIQRFVQEFVVVQVQHGHKIKSLGAILNFKQFCV